MSHRLSELAPITLEFFEKYLSTGHLVDLYSESFLSRFESDSTTVIPYSIAKFKSLDRRVGTDYRNHLYVLYLGDRTPELIDDFFDGFSLERPKNPHLPSLPFLVLFNRSIDLLRTVRITSGGSISLDDYAAQGLTDFNPLLKSFPPASDKQFYALDYCRLAQRMMNSLRSLIQSTHKLKSLPCADDLPIQRSDGLFYFAESNLGMTRAKASATMNTYERLLSTIDEKISALSWYFPMIDIADVFSAIDVNSHQ